MAKQLMLIKDAAGQDHYVNVERVTSVTKNSSGNTEIFFEGNRSITTKKALPDVVGEVNHFMNPKP